jgi:hypothetical protein
MRHRRHLRDLRLVLIITCGLWLCRETRVHKVNKLAAFWWLSEDSYLVDPASSHMLVSKIKPCMSKYKQLYGETANGSLNQL